LESENSLNNKSVILNKLNILENLKGSSEYSKLKNWINKIMKVPFGNYISPSVKITDSNEKIKYFLQNIRNNLNKNIYGHNATKEQLIKIIAQTITNPNEGGNIFALQGPPGIGKTALIQDGISKALERPFAFISLGGATDASFLEGHDYTYEGSTNGRIVDVLCNTGCMNPIIYFDELDKVSETPKGEEIINILMHITDSTQNHHFHDKYFSNINFDLSRAIIIFSFNDGNKISRILKDRMKIIRIGGYKLIDKINIAKKYLIPKLFTQFRLSNSDVFFSDNILEYIIDTYTHEGGVRKLKEILNDILLEINLRKLENSKILNKKINCKINISKSMLENDLLKKKQKIEHTCIDSHPSVGHVNGLWASDYGIGGLSPIECSWIPAKDKLKLELTGMQGKIMQESMSVAKTVAWKILPSDLKKSLNKKWNECSDYGIHIHCPDGATPKDGPSAGGAITTCLISLLTKIPINNKLAMTGEINLKGQITKIGGLEEKIFGAKKAGVEIVLCPFENLKDLEEIKNKFPSLFDKNFSVKTVNNIWDILDLVLLKKFNYQKF
jgi:endopeptidase La